MNSYLLRDCETDEVNAILHTESSAEAIQCLLDDEVRDVDAFDSLLLEEVLDKYGVRVQWLDANHENDIWW